MWIVWYVWFLLAIQFKSVAEAPQGALYSKVKTPKYYRENPSHQTIPYKHEFANSGKENSHFTICSIRFGGQGGKEGQDTHLCNKIWASQQVHETSAQANGTKMNEWISGGHLAQYVIMYRKRSVIFLNTPAFEL